ncbi:MAG: hypothetical protein A2583_08495 [Bdellovibrionales bacterium RIFOXYD1_FULL_53_11]|nr:MAG: hypothetical protein A2583_08495 [Bdellovibrionales bacterium RIFOXYD1_FULL_53_11]
MTTRQNGIFKLVLLGCAMAAFQACSSGPTKVDVEEPDFKVMEATPGGREGWLDNAQSWAEDNGLDAKANYFFTGEARSADKRMACEKAHADVIDDISRQVAVFTDTTFGRAKSESSQSDSNQADASQVSEETQRISAQLSKAHLSNIAVNKKYWERRDYSATGGAKNVNVCWVLASIDKQEMNKLIKRAGEMKIKANPELKEKVDKKLETIDQKYEEWQKTH